MAVSEGTDSLIISSLAPSRLLAYGRCNGASGGAFVGKNAGGGGSGQTSIPIGTAEVYPSNNLIQIPVTPGQLLRIKFKFWAAGPPDANTEWYFRLRINTNVNEQLLGEFRYASSGANASSPYGEFLYVVPAGVNILYSVAVVVLKNSGSGNLFRYNDYQDSWMTVESLAPDNTTPTPSPADLTPTWIGVTPNSGYTIPDGRPILYCKDAMGFVHMKGFVSGASGSAVFTLPAGFRPTQASDFGVSGAGGNYAMVQVLTDGRVIPLIVSGNAFSLHPVQFSTT